MGDDWHSFQSPITLKEKATTCFMINWGLHEHQRHHGRDHDLVTGQLSAARNQYGYHA